MKRAMFVVTALGVLGGCPQEPRERPDVVCADACKKRVVGCNAHECERGCAFVLDRLVEHEQATVLGCMERAQSCTDSQWADCATRVGPHIDGGPSVPAPIEPE